MAGRLTGDIGSSVVGDIDWVDLTNNWRAQDAEWLQERGVARVANTPPNLTTDYLANINAGRLFFNTVTKALLISTDGTNDGIKAAVISNALTATDSSTTVTLGISGQTPNITFTKSTGAVSAASMTIASLTSTAGSSSSGFRTTASGVEINTTGSNNIVLTTGSSGLAISGSVVIAGGVTTSTASTFGAGVTVSSGNVIVSTGNLEVSTGSTSVQSLTVNSTLGVTGAVTGSSTASFTTGTFTGLTTTVGTDLTITIGSGRAIRWTSPDGPAGVDVYYANTAARMAFVVTGTGLTATDYPEGTIWVS